MLYRIGEFAGLTGVSVDTLRYYEKLGLLSPQRDSGGRRCYSAEDAAWMRFVNRLKQIGMPLADIQRYSLLRSLGEATVQQRLQMLLDYRRKLEQKMDELQGQMRFLDEKIALYRGAAGGQEDGSGGGNITESRMI